MTFRKHANACIRDHYGHFPFADFGFGSLTEFLSRHNFKTPVFDKMSAKEAWMDNLEPDLAACCFCKCALPRNAFSIRQLRSWDAKGRRSRPKCQRCLQDVAANRNKPSQGDSRAWIDPEVVVIKGSTLPDSSSPSCRQEGYEKPKLSWHDTSHSSHRSRWSSVQRLSKLFLRMPS